MHHRYSTPLSWVKAAFRWIDSVPAGQHPVTFRLRRLGLVWFAVAELLAYRGLVWDAAGDTEYCGYRIRYQQFDLYEVYTPYWPGFRSAASYGGSLAECRRWIDLETPSEPIVVTLEWLEGQASDVYGPFPTLADAHRWVDEVQDGTNDGTFPLLIDATFYIQRMSTPFDVDAIRQQKTTAAYDAYAAELN